MLSRLLISALALGLLATAAPPAFAQVLPIPRGTDWEDERRRFSGDALRDLNRLLVDWSTAAGANDARGAARFYTSNAIMHFESGAPVEGRAAIEQALGEILPGIRQLRTGVSDFAVSGNLAYALGRFWYEEQVQGSGTTQVTGTYVVVAERHGRDWRIRSQVFKQEPTLN